MLLAVTDTGIGMDEEIARALFEPFFTTKPGGKGTGLGLATVYGIVKQSGGDICVYSEPGSGTTFKIYLPARGRAGGVEPAAAARARAGRAATETVLLVEDDANVRELVPPAARGTATGARPARDADEAVRVCTELGRSTCCSTDVVMPDDERPGARRAASPRRPDMRVLFMSGYTDEAVLRHGVLAERGLHREAVHRAGAHAQGARGPRRLG